MTGPDNGVDAPATTRIPADISRPDRILGPFTARQTGLLAVAAVLLYGGYWVTRPFAAPLTYAVLVLPLVGAVTAVVLGRRDGIGLDRFLLAALAHARSAKRRVHAPEGIPHLPAAVPRRWSKAAESAPATVQMPYAGVTAQGVLELRRDGKAAGALCSTVNFDLRSAAEQQGLTAGFARWLNSLTGPVQILVRCHRIDLTPLADALRRNAAALPHPALEQAAYAHGDFLADLASGDALLSHQVLLVAREEPRELGGRRVLGEARVLQRMEEAARALASAEITVRPLDGSDYAELVRAACNPETWAPHGAASEGDQA